MYKASMVDISNGVARHINTPAEPPRQPHMHREVHVTPPSLGMTLAGVGCLSCTSQCEPEGLVGSHVEWRTSMRLLATMASSPRRAAVLADSPCEGARHMRQEIWPVG